MQTERLGKLSEKIKKLAEEQAKAKELLREIKRKERQKAQKKIRQEKAKWLKEVNKSLLAFYPMPVTQIIEALKKATASTNNNAEEI